MSAAKRRVRWQGGDAADSTGVRQGAPNAASGILIELLTMSPILKHSGRLAVIAVAALSAGCITQQVSQSSDRLIFRYNVYDFSGNAYNRAKKQCTGKDKKMVHLETNCGFLICESAFKCVDAKQ